MRTLILFLGFAVLIGGCAHFGNSKKVFEPTTRSSASDSDDYFLEVSDELCAPLLEHVDVLGIKNAPELLGAHLLSVSEYRTGSMIASFRWQNIASPNERRLENVSYLRNKNLGFENEESLAFTYLSTPHAKPGKRPTPQERKRIDYNRSTVTSRIIELADEISEEERTAAKHIAEIVKKYGVAKDGRFYEQHSIHTLMINFNDKDCSIHRTNPYAR